MRNPALISPVQDLDRHITETLGVQSQRELVRAIGDGARGKVSPRQTWGYAWPYWRANVGASGDNTYLMRVGTPSGDAAWAMTASVLIPMPAAGVITGGALWSSEARTAGTATLRVRVIDSAGTTDRDITDCVLNASTTQAMSSLLLDSTIRFAKGATIEARIVTVSWTPTTADMGALIFTEFDIV